ncbi:MAG TPA: heavy metal-associated domain-containing protein [Phycisphaerales bacterium]|nr:heavy metal-associated domain-containing protein [Phycisphaerales bacterium]HMP36134.1 heavy metal-associated domain-containing protein [Phycisphaerales bacterium]
MPLHTFSRRLPRRTPRPTVARPEHRSRAALPIALMALLSFAVASACETTPRTPADAESPRAAESGQLGSPSAPEPRTAYFVVNGMGCPLCANNVDRQLRNLPGVERVTINLGTGVVAARLSPENPPSQAQLERAVRASGFTLVGSTMPETSS